MLKHPKIMKVERILPVFWGFVLIAHQALALDLGGSLSLDEQDLPGGGYRVVLDNQTVTPLTVYLDGNGSNGLPEPILPATVVVPAGTSQTILEVRPQNSSNPVSFDYSSPIYLGDYRSVHDDGYLYALPYAVGTNWQIIQTYLGGFSHQLGESWAYAIDFEMPVGTPLHAVRAGKVVAIKEDSDRGGPTIDFGDDANVIWILHEDGSMANYLHLRLNGVVPSPGDWVERGELIGYSGNTGFSTTPHLHYGVYVHNPFNRRQEAIPVKTLTKQGPDAFPPVDARLQRPGEGSLYSGLYQASSAWTWSPWFGYFSFAGNFYIYHLDLGWLYFVDGDTSGTWFWGIDSTWYYTSPVFYPFMYAYSRSSWEWKG